jgi:tetratricopeptide (TPR) repeat protein
MHTLRNASFAALSLVFIATAPCRATADEADNLLLRGEKSYRNGDFNAAIRCFTEAIRLKPEFADAYRDRGMAYEKKDDHDKAIADYNEAIRLRPHYAAAYDSRGNAYDNKGEYDRAIADYREAIRLNPHDASPYYNRGIALARKGDFDKAIADYTEAIRLKPDFAAAYRHRGMAYGKKGDLDKASADNAEAARHKPGIEPRSTSSEIYFALIRYLPWLEIVCLATLAAAAFLHWQRTRHWCLLTLAAGFLLMTVAGTAAQITQRLLRPGVVLPSGAVRFDTSLLTI